MHNAVRGLSLGASAADEQAPAPMKLRLMQGFSYEGKAVGDDIGVSGEYKVQVNGPATAKLSESWGRSARPMRRPLILKSRPASLKAKRPASRCFIKAPTI